MSRRTNAIYHKWTPEIHPHYKRKVQSLTAAKITRRLQRSKKWMNWPESESVDRIMFSDEKLFCTDQSYKLKMLLYIQQLSMTYLDKFEIFNAFRSRIPLLFGRQRHTMKNCPGNWSIKNWKPMLDITSEKYCLHNLLSYADRLHSKKNGFSARFCTVATIR